jgi:hypothetical protein
MQKEPNTKRDHIWCMVGFDDITVDFAPCFHCLYSFMYEGMITALDKAIGGLEDI